MSPPPIWLHGEMTREQAEALIKSNGGPDGQFLVRLRPKQGDHALAVVFRGRATHHLLKENDDGVWAVNNKVYGNAKTLEELINTLTQATPGWPVVLHPPIPNKEVEEKEQPSPSAPPSTPSLAGNGASSGPSEDEDVGESSSDEEAATDLGESTADSPFFHRSLSRPAAESMVIAYAKQENKGQVNGVWLIRQRPKKDDTTEDDDKFVLTVGFGGKVTHHLLNRQADGTFTINSNPTGGSTFEAVVRFLRTKPRFWPAELNAYVPNGPDAPYSDESSSVSVPTSTPEQKPEPVKAPEPEPESKPIKQPEPTPVPTHTTTTTTPQSRTSSKVPRPPELQLTRDDAAALIKSNPLKILRLTRPEPGASFGFSIDSGIPPMVTRLAPDGPAERAGMETTDLVVRLGGKDVMDLAKNEIPLLIKNAGINIQILVLKPAVAFRAVEEEPNRPKSRAADLTQARQAIATPQSDDDDDDNLYCDDE